MPQYRNISVESFILISEIKLRISRLTKNRTLIYLTIGQNALLSLYFKNGWKEIHLIKCDFILH